jgi:uncharacterized protein
MKCPNCNETLVMTDRQGVEIDYCPQCRGVWLDKGELDKIIERSAAFETGDSSNYSQDREDYRPKYNEKHDPRYPHRKKRGFLGDLFDFD